MLNCAISFGKRRAGELFHSNRSAQYYQLVASTGFFSGKIAIGDLFSNYIAIGHLFSAGGTIAIGDLFSGGCFAIGDLFLPGVQLQLAISGELDRIWK